MTLVRFNPMRDMLNFEREISRLFNSFENKVGFPKKEVDEELENAVWSPLTDITEDKDNFFLKLDLPGVAKEDVKISFNNGQLCVSGERKQEKEEKETTYHRVERIYGKYYRSFTLPKEIKLNEITADFKNGQLSVTIPKAEEIKPKELEIKVN